MNESCVISPSKGKKLYSKCISSFGRDLGIRVFLLGINPNFNNDYKNSLSLDAEGVPLFDSLIQNKIVRTYIGEHNMLEFINRSLSNSRYENTNEGFREAIDKAKEFNTSSQYRDYYIVYPKTVDDENESYITLYANKKDDNQNEEFADAAYSIDYRNTLIQNMNESGIAEKDIEDTARFLGISTRSINGLDALINSINPSAQTNLGKAYFISKMFSSEPLVQRTRHYIQSEDMVKDILERNGYPTSDMNEDTIDAALGLYLLENTNKPPVATRASDLVAEKLSSLDLTNVYDASREAHLGTNNYLSLPSSSLNTIGGEETINEEALNNLSEDLKKFEDSIESLQTLELKKVNIYNSGLDGLRALKSPNIVDGLLTYLQGANDELTELKNTINNMGELTLQEQCETIKKALDYSRAYDLIFEEIQKILFGENSILNQIEDNEALNSLNTALSTILSINRKLLNTSIDKASALFTEFMRPIIGDNVTIDYGKSKGTTYSIKQIMESADKDITILSRWLDSAGNSSDIVLQGAHIAIKRQKDKARYATLKILERVQVMSQNAKEAGLTDFSFMYELSEGKRTGNYITKYNIGEYIDAREKVLDSLNEKNKDASPEDREKNIDKGMREWHDANSILTTEGFVPNSKYINEQFKNMTDAQEKFYNEFMEIKKSLDDLLPDGETSIENAIKVRKGTLDRILTSKNPFKVIQESVKDSILERSDDTEFGVSGKTDLSNKEIHTVPIYYTKMKKNESTDDLTNDVVSALVAYAYMANNYRAMNEVSAALELGREVMAKRKAPKRRDRRTVERLNGLGLNREIDIFKNKTEAEALYNELMESQVYGIYIKDNGNIHKTPISKNKLTSLMLRTGSSIQLGLNFLAGVANAANGLAMQNIEVAAREFFTAKDLKDADLYYMKHLHKMIGELGTDIKTNELDLIFRFFNVKQDFDKDTKGITSDKRKLILKMFGPSVLYLYQTAGDNFLYGRSALAILRKTQVLKDGKKMSLLEALNFEEIIKGRNAGKTITLNGIKNLDGTDFTEEDASKISRRIEYINQKCFGVYNNEDINAARRTIAGRFLLQYRDWMRPAFMRRFQGTHYNVLLEETREGYYISGIRYLANLLSDIKKGQLNILRTYRNMKEGEQANVRMCVREISQYVAVLALLALVDWPEDKKENWALSMLEYTLRRQKTELGSVVPGPLMATEFFNILKSPMANVSVMESTTDLLKLIYKPSVYEKELQSGRFKGHTEAYKILMNSFIGLQTKNIRRMLDPADAINYQKRND